MGEKPRESRRRKHHEDGTVSTFQGDASVFTLSIHGEKNFPFRKESSDLDIGLLDGCGGADKVDPRVKTILNSV